MVPCHNAGDVHSVWGSVLSILSIISSVPGKTAGHCGKLMGVDWARKLIYVM